METYGLVLVRGDDGHGGWSLHAPRSTDAQIREGEAPPLVSGPVDDQKDSEWSRPTQRDYDRAARRARLPPRRVRRSEVSTLTKPEMLILPEELASRILRVDAMPTDLLRAASADPKIMYSLTSQQFEQFVATLIERIGFWSVELTARPRGDGGKDIVARKTVAGIPLAFYFECKRYAEQHKVQLDTVRALLGVVAHDAGRVNIGVLVTTSTFTFGAQELIRSDCRLDGKDYEGIESWLAEYRRLFPNGAH